MKHFVHIFLLLSMCFCFQVQAQGLKTIKLKNGMSVFIWDDSGKSDVFGEVVVRTGAVNDPDEYTGLAHYVEHVMFKVHRRSVHSTGKRKLPFMNKS